MDEDTTFTAFCGSTRLATGPLGEVLAKAKVALDGGRCEGLLFFEDDTGRQVDFDFRGTVGEVVERAVPPKPAAGPGRPKLGVVSREVSLLPRHWAWLDAQPQGLSGTLRRLIDDARKRDPDAGKVRRTLDAASRVMTAMAGNLAGYEEASRALFARDRIRFEGETLTWPDDLRAYFRERLEGVWAPEV